jgi:hypothetical protein
MIARLRAGIENPRVAGSTPARATFLQLVGKAATMVASRLTFTSFVVHESGAKEVLRYQNTRLDNATPLTSGYIAIQAETHPIEFRKIEILPLPGNQSAGKSK